MPAPQPAQTWDLGANPSHKYTLQDLDPLHPPLPLRRDHTLHLGPLLRGRRERLYSTVLLCRVLSNHTDPVPSPGIEALGRRPWLITSAAPTLRLPGRCSPRHPLPHRTGCQTSPLRPAQGTGKQAGSQAGRQAGSSEHILVWSLPLRRPKHCPEGSRGSCTVPPLRPLAARLRDSKL